MSQNPFSSNTFAKIWMKHFGFKNKAVSLKGLDGVEFIRDSSSLPLYVNVGKNLTKGMDYDLGENQSLDIKNKCFIIQDVNVFIQNKKSLKIDDNSFGKFTIPQYPGFSINLKGYDSLESFLQQHFKKSSRYKFNKYKRRLEQSFSISYNTFLGEMDKGEFEHLFKEFRHLLEKRFSQKKVYNNNMDPAEWNFYTEVAYPMILEKKAGLFVVYDDEKPIAITLLYFYGKTVIDSITVFDPDYSKFHLGSCSIMYLISWCVQNDYHILDFSKGYFDYKTRWCTDSYEFEYHILYNPKSPISAFTAHYFRVKYRLKAFLREKKVNLLAHRARYILQNFPKPAQSSDQQRYIGKNDMDFTNVDDWKGIDLNEISEEIKLLVFNFLYLNGGKKKETSLLYSSKSNVYMIQGKNHREFLVPNSAEH